jgi:thymidylate kinase
MLTKIQKLIEELNTNGIRYCHWKSNLSLSQVLSGQTDADLLIHRKDADLFRSILGQLCFRPAIVQVGAAFPSVEHYFALDEETGILVHVHAYFRVITGESLSKNYHFPIEEMLLQNVRESDSVRVPIKSAELVIFTLRMMLKHTSLVELVLLARDWEQVKQEIQWLLESKSIDETVKLVEHWLPPLDIDLFSECVTALQLPAPLIRRIILGLRLRSRLSIYSRHSSFRAWLSGVQKFSTMAFQRLTRSKKGMIPQSGGAVIAFVGPEATGKSTLLAEIRNWLGEHFAVDQIHAGKPRSTLLTIIPNLLVPALRYVLPSYRSSHIETAYVKNEQLQKSQKVYPLLFAVRSVLIAYDRRALLTRAFARAANGNIMLSDRYPSLSNGAPDSPQLQQFPVPRNRYPIRHLLARIEKRLYQEIPPPDLVVSLNVPIDVALLRNKTRGKEEPEDYVRLRHAQSSHLDFGNTPVCEIFTNQPLEETVLEIKNAIWDAL